MNQASSKQTIWFVTCVEKKKTRTRFSGCANKHTVCCLGKKINIVGNKDLEKSCMRFFFKEKKTHLIEN